MGTHQLATINNNDTFEDSICDLFNCIESTNSYKRFGKNGHQQKGIDIFSSENDCAIQCKKKDLSRKEILLKQELLEDIKKDVQKVLAKDLKIKISRLIFVSTFKDHPDIDEYCEVLKEDLKTDFEIMYWGWDTLEKKFLVEKKLLQRYWRNFIIRHDSKEIELQRDLELKKKISRDFGDWLNYAPEKRDKNSRMLIRSFDGTQYPQTNLPDEFGEYSWFRAEIKSLYHNGMEFVIGIDSIQVFEDNSWDYITDEKKTAGVKVKVAKVGRINFADIVDYDIDGDEHYISPHIFCKFKYRGTPFEEIYYYDVTHIYNQYELANWRGASV